MNKKLMEQVLDALITYRDFINNAHIIEGQFHWLEGTGDAIKALEEALKQEQRKPLTDKQIDEIYFKSDLNIDDQYNQLYEFVKAIESAHGIKELNHD